MSREMTSSDPSAESNNVTTDDDIIEVSTVEEGKFNVHIGSEINCRDVDQLHISCFDCSKCSRKMSPKVTKISCNASHQDIHHFLVTEIDHFVYACRM